MRIVYDLQLNLDSVLIEEIKINPNSRDKMESFFSAVRQIFLDDSTRERLFQLLEQYYKPDTRKDCGRPGMMLWRVVILAALKQTIHCDYDRLTTLANGLENLRLILGHGREDTTRYTRSTIYENVSALSPELLQEVNQIVVEAGHKILGRPAGKPIKSR